MSDFEIDFENEVGRHELQPATTAKVEKWRAEHPKDLKGMSDEEAAFYLGDLVRKGRFKTNRATSAMLEKSVRALVECKETPFHKVALTVANTIGGWRDETPVFIWHRVAERLRLMFERKAYEFPWRGPKKLVDWPHPAAQNIGELEIFLIPDKDGKPVLSLQPHDFQDALYLYAARMIAIGTTFQICEQCKIPFLSGGTRGNNRRGDARFCSDECRYSYHNEVRRKARKSKL